MVPALPTASLHTVCTRSMLYTPKNAFSGHEYVPYKIPEKHPGIFGDSDDEADEADADADENNMHDKTAEELEDADGEN